ncbi:right-handed parallel beta-helix repeat-containing protein [uncultured Methanobacterium sp.]|uniref:right-handed parallel beta-helix repeat-containing protein n=1 Tax=uncultured Methanobacterium sp. TaxID=176306 RepID=UPI002AA7D322|nr:right-handed parallel beta-helix repeat-containing protein [uncultured Methanobacterium sp.]
MKTINTGINAVDENGTVNVANGIYYELVTVDRSLNLVGENRYNTVIDANALGRPLYITTDSNVTIENFTLCNGYDSMYGGGIYSDADLTINNCNISGNVVGGKRKGYGGGIYTTGTTTINNSIITGNSGDFGGGLYAAGTTLINNSIINENVAWEGAGVYFIGDNLTVRYSRIYNAGLLNEIYPASGTVDARYNWWGQNSGPQEGQIYGNITYSPWLYMNFDTNSTLMVNGSTCQLNANFNYLCDGRYIEYLWDINPAEGHLPDGCPVIFTTDLGSLDGSKITTQNTVNGIAITTLTGDEGSGFANVTAQLDSQILNVIIQMDNPNYNNTTPGHDYDDRYVNYLTGNDTWDGTSPIYINGTRGPMKTIQAAINVVGENGTIHVASGTYYEHLTIGKNLNLVGEDPATTIIDANNNGRALYITDVDDVTIANFTIRYGHSTSNGGGIYSNGGLTVDNCIITDNDAINNGGGMFVTGQTLVKNSIITRNFASAGSGIASAGTSTLTMRYSIIENNPYISSSEIYSLNNPIDARYNWWGQNSGPKTGQVDASVLYSPWIYMTSSASDYSITNGETSQIFANFNNIYDGSTINSTDPAYGNLTVNFLLFSVIFSTDRGILSGGILNNGNNSLQNIENGVATITLTSDGSVGFAHVTAQFRFQTLDLTIRTHDNNLYVNVEYGNDSFDGTSPIPLFSNGTVGPKKTIQAAIDVINENQTIYVTNGTYNDTSLKITKRINLFGDSAILVGNCIDPVISILTGAASGTSVMGFVINGVVNIYGISLNAVNDVNITNNTITGNLVGIDLWNSLNNTIIDNNISGNSWSGICLDTSNGNIITGNNVTGNQEGIFLSNSTQNTIYSNTLSNNKYTGSTTISGGLNSIQGNNIQSNGVSGILVQRSAGNVISENTVQSNGWSGICLDQSTGTVVFNIVTSNQEGIFIANNAMGNMIRNNTVVNSTFTGVSILGGSGSNVVSGNSVSGNGFNGILMQNSNQNTVQFNTVRDNGWSGICLDQSTGTVVFNIVTSNQEGIFIANNAMGNMIRNNTVVNSTFTGVSILGGSGSNVVSGNSVSGNGFNGILVQNSNQNTVQFNTVRDNGLCGLCFDQANNTTVTMNNIENNPEQAYDNRTNSYDDGSTGNYWSDWSNSDPRSIDGGSNVDNYPAATPFK